MREFVLADGLSPALSEAYRPAAPGEGLTAYLARFAAWDATVQSPERMARVVAELGADLASDGIVHAEVRLRPPTDDDRLWHTMMEAAVATGRRLVTPGLGFITVLLRGWTTERAEREARRTVAWAARGVVALDVAGDEGLGGIRPLEGAIRLAREAGLGITAHAGETGDAASVREALALLGPDRIAHGVASVEDGALMAELRERGVHLEMAIRSNAQTGSVPHPAHHPFARLARLGLHVGLSTDNSTISGTTLSDEYALAAAALGLTWTELARVTERAVKVRHREPEL